MPPRPPACAPPAPPPPGRVLGLDPGTRHFGWGVVTKQGNRLVHVAHGIVHTDERAPIAERLVQIEADLAEVLRAHGPSQASIESLFFAKDAQAAAKLGHARGVALLVCARQGVPIAEYPPARVKRTVAGGGRAEKSQVAQMVRVLLGLPEAPRADAADALAVAVTHLQNGAASLPGVSRPNPLVAALGRAKRARGFHLSDARSVEPKRDRGGRATRAAE